MSKDSIQSWALVFLFLFKKSIFVIKIMLLQHFSSTYYFKINYISTNVEINWHISQQDLQNISFSCGFSTFAFALLYKQDQQSVIYKQKQMHLQGQYMQKGIWFPESQMNKRRGYTQLITPNFNADFSYRRGTKYIRLSEEKYDVQMYYQDYGIFLEENKVVKSYILDQNLSIILQGTLPRNLDQQLLKQEKYLQGKLCNQHEPKYQDLPQLSFEKNIFQVPQPSLSPIKYKVYPSINDFIIGRSHHVRDLKSHKISSDCISRQHCEISHFKNNDPQVEKYLNLMKDIIYKRTRRGSKFRKISSYLWKLIVQYIKPKQRYFLCDLGSRIGTWVYQLGTQTLPLQQNYDYQFEKQSYSIHVNKIYTSRDSQNKSILEHNEKAFMLVQQFKKQVNWNYYQRANKIMIVQDADNIMKKTNQKIQILIFKLRYRDFHQYYLLAVNESFQKKYSVGCKHDIDINPEEYDSPSLHGTIFITQGKWMIESFQYRNNGEYRKVWKKLIKDNRYQLNTQKCYKIRLGSSYYLSLDFQNYKKSPSC